MSVYKAGGLIREARIICLITRCTQFKCDWSNGYLVYDYMYDRCGVWHIVWYRIVVSSDLKMGSIIIDRSFCLGILFF